MNLISLKNEVEAAKELLAQAEENYKKGILEAAQNGELAERKTAMWKEVYIAADCKTKLFCDGCGYYAPLRSDFCPKCGAKMANPQHYAPKQAAAWISKTETPLNEADVNNLVKGNIADTSPLLKKVDWNKKDKPEKQTLVLKECEKLLRQYNTAIEASRAIGKSDKYISTLKTVISKYDSTPTYSTYYFIARALHEC